MKPDYGIDAPGVILGLGLGGMALVLLALSLRLSPLLWWGGAWIATALAMLAYARVGKLRHRDRMLALAALGGDEQVLDVGTGRGLLAIGAARQLRGGRALGIDIFATKDLSGNALPRTLANVQAEGVADRCQVRHEDARTLALADGSIDVVLSNLCLHNIAPRAERARALGEIARVLKPGGRALLSDFLHTGEYAEFLRRAGFAVTVRGPYLLDTFFPLRIVDARKPGGPVS